ncbi:MAG: hexokinase [Actinobacteria bacterium]|nr:hexokinase [Actinomycetota bacterium]
MQIEMRNLKDDSKINKLKKKTVAFLSSHGMNPSDIDAKKYVKFFIEEMNAGLAGEEKSSLKMLPTYLTGSSIGTKTPVIALDAGGTNLRSAVVSFDADSNPVIGNTNKTSMPGTTGAASKEVFFATIADNIKDIISEGSSIGFVFSYPIEIYPDMDGRLLHFTKEVRAPEVEGEFIGKNLLEILGKKAGIKDRKIVLLNDTPAVLLSGIAAFSQRQYDSCIGLVLGTGMNACYIEKNSNILKISNSSGFPDKSCQLINVEAGNFSRGPRGKIDEIFDAGTINPGHGTFEKMFSGAYMGGLATEVIKIAAKEKLFSAAGCRILGNIQTLESKEIDIYLDFPPRSSLLGEIFNELQNEDKIILYLLLDNLIERAALLTSIVLAALLTKSCRGFNPCHPVCIIAEGSSFYKMNNFKTRVECCLKNVLAKNSFNDCRPGIYYEIKKVENSVMLGAAVAAASIA